MFRLIMTPPSSSSPLATFPTDSSSFPFFFFLYSAYPLTLPRYSEWNSGSFTPTERGGAFWWRQFHRYGWARRLSRTWGTFLIPKFIDSVASCWDGETSNQFNRGTMRVHYIGANLFWCRLNGIRRVALVIERTSSRFFVRWRAQINRMGVGSGSSSSLCSACSMCTMCDGIFHGEEVVASNVIKSSICWRGDKRRGAE